MTHQERTRLFSKVDTIAKVMPAADAFSFFNNLTEAFREAQEVRRDLAKIEAMRAIVVAEITRRYDL